MTICRHYWDNVKPYRIGTEKRAPEDTRCIRCGLRLLDYIKTEATRIGQWPPQEGNLIDNRKVIA